jgi:hypothetical protein
MFSPWRLSVVLSRQVCVWGVDECEVYSVQQRDGQVLGGAVGGVLCGQVEVTCNTRLQQLPAFCLSF